MATAYKTPGVYIEEISKFPPSIAEVETAVPAFIGYTQKADNLTANDLHLVPTRITSLLEFENYFGLPQPEQKITVTLNVTQTAAGAVTGQTAVASMAEADRSKHILHYALQLYFANGGGPAYIVSIGLYKPNFGDPLMLSDFELGKDTLTTEPEPTLIVFPEAQNLANIGDFNSLHNDALAQCAHLQNRFVIMDVHGGDANQFSLSNPKTNLLAAVKNYRDHGIGMDNLLYGAAYAPNLETVLKFVFDDSKTSVVIITNGAAAAPVELSTLKTTQNQVYTAATAAIAAMPNILPPSAAMAGIYAAVDNSRGVWKAPANVGVNAVIQPTIQVSNDDHGLINVDSTAGKSVNVIRAFIGKGTLVWGARTLAGNDNEWRYISVRRFFIFAEQSIKNATEQFVFEPNDANTWVKLQGMIENFLTTLWRQGALQGIKPEQAFYVAVGLGKTMSALDIVEGRLIIEIGMAVVHPAEFIILRFSQMMAQS